MRKQFSRIEIELVQLREQLDQQQPNSLSSQNTLTIFRREQEDIVNGSQLGWEFQQDRASLGRQLDYLSEEVKQLRSDRDSCKMEIAALREELLERDRTLLSLQETLKTRCSLPTVTPQSQTIPTQTSPALAQPPHCPTPGSSPNLTQPAPASSHSHAPIPAPVDSTPHFTQTAQTHGGRRAEIILLMDSNRKFLDEQTLFPRHRVEKIWCPNTQRALELLTVAELGAPSHIIIHAGTNDLRSQQERVADSLRRMIEKASTTFPTSKIIISTLLPRRDFHPHTIRQPLQGLCPETQCVPGAPPNSRSRLPVWPHTPVQRSSTDPREEGHRLQQEPYHHPEVQSSSTDPTQTSWTSKISLTF